MLTLTTISPNEVSEKQAGPCWNLLRLCNCERPRGLNTRL